MKHLYNWIAFIDYCWINGSLFPREETCCHDTQVTQRASASSPLCHSPSSEALLHPAPDHFGLWRGPQRLPRGGHIALSPPAGIKGTRPGAWSAFLRHTWTHTLSASRSLRCSFIPTLATESSLSQPFPPSLPCSLSQLIQDYWAWNRSEWQHCSMAPLSPLERTTNPSNSLLSSGWVGVGGERKKEAGGKGLGSGSRRWQWGGWK